jgi:hypothetical protein
MDGMCFFPEDKFLSGPMIQSGTQRVDIVFRNIKEKAWITENYFREPGI